MNLTTARVLPFRNDATRRADAASIAHEIIGLTMTEGAEHMTADQRNSPAFVEELFRRVMLCIRCHKFWWRRASDVCGICEGKRT